MTDTPGLPLPCPAGIHRYHRSRASAEQCQRQAEIMRAGRPFVDDPRVQHAEEVRRQGPPRQEGRPL